MLDAGLVATTSALLWAASLDTGWCRPETPPRVIITPKTEDITYDFTRSIADLNQKETDTINPYGENEITDTGGLMSGGIQTRHSVSFKYVLNKSAGLACVWYDRLEVEIRISPTIYVAREYEKGSCMRAAILEHEHKHIRVDREMVNKYARLIGERLQKQLNAKYIYGPVRIDQRQATSKTLADTINSIIKKYNKVMQQERTLRQQAVDSFEEYERVSAQCPEKQWRAAREKAGLGKGRYSHQHRH